MLNYMLKNAFGVYQYRRRIPKDLLHCYPQFAGGFLKFSLRTKDRSEANKLLKQFDARYEQEFEDIRKSLRGEGNPASQPECTVEPAQADIGTIIAKPSSITGKTLHDLLPLWKNEQKPTGNSELEWTTAVKRFEQYFGKLPIDRITSTHIRHFRDALALVPKWSGKYANFKNLVEASKTRTDTFERLAPATINKNLSAISSLLNLAVEYGFLTHNPANRIKVKEKVRSIEKRLPFDKADLGKLFNSPLYMGCASEDKRHVPGSSIYKDAKYWMPLLALYTGSRIEELAQALLKDIRNESGIVYLDINSHGNGKKSLKTASSIRKVPLHQDVLSAGFLEYLAHLQHNKADRLFPDLGLASKNTYSQPVSKWFTRFRREIGITHDKKTFHSFRHTFKDMCREAGLSQEIHDALTGHGKATVSNSYGSGFSLKVLNEAVQRIESPIKLEHLLMTKSGRF